VKSIGALGVSLAITALALSNWPAARDWARVVAESAGPLAQALTDAPVASLLGAAAALVLILVLTGKMLELKDKRAAEAIAVQGEIADALDRDPTLVGFPMTPSARVPLWRGTPVTVKVIGHVPSVALRKAALDAAEQAAAELLVRVRIKSRIGVAKPKKRRRAG
jgi:hypothetical protein